ncbi:hypothetical protein NPIL_156731 [Nephila pilipes]|uniref:Uncharacterized protein n=1 Tax=Nephila pilipes TaxID=299642 RepID=A0A8X6TN27_NEPPI|nr:hypothetical protein NPIL_156731 [Nephila pilipes]
MINEGKEQETQFGRQSAPWGCTRFTCSVPCFEMRKPCSDLGGSLLFSRFLISGFAQKKREKRSWDGPFTELMPGLPADADLGGRP